MVDNVMEFTGATTLEIDPVRMLHNVAKGKPAKVLIITEDAEGNFQHYCSYANRYEMVFTLEYLKNKLVNGEY